MAEMDPRLKEASDIALHQTLLEVQREYVAWRQRAERLEEALRELAEADEDYDVDTMTQWPVSQPVGSGERRGKAMIAAKVLLAASILPNAPDNSR